LIPVRDTEASELQHGPSRNDIVNSARVSRSSPAG
jgi:hypothetical protein